MFLQCNPAVASVSFSLSVQKEEERLRASIRRESQQRRMREKQHQRGLNAGYLEPDRYDEDEEGDESISLAAIKSKYKGGGLRGRWWRAKYYGALCIKCSNIFRLYTVKNVRPLQLRNF